jgi:hypothetical protein
MLTAARLGSSYALSKSRQAYLQNFRQNFQWEVPLQERGMDSDQHRCELSLIYF